VGLALDGEYHLLKDGWIKIDRSDYEVGLPARNSGRLLLGLNQLLVRIGGKHILVDTGLGEKWLKAELGLLDYESPRKLTAELLSLGVLPEEIDIVVLTHLHYDHSGGATVRRGDLVAPAFPNSVYYVNELELKNARNPSPDKQDDYRSEDFEPLIEYGCLECVGSEHEVMPGVTLYHAPGHSVGHQIVRFDLCDETLLFTGDLISTQAHANLLVTMVYDEDRDSIFQHRRKWLEASNIGNWKLVFCHAVRNQICRVTDLKDFHS